MHWSEKDLDKKETPLLYSRVTPVFVFCLEALKLNWFVLPLRARG